MHAHCQLTVPRVQLGNKVNVLFSIGYIARWPFQKPNPHGRTFSRFGKVELFYPPCPLFSPFPLPLSGYAFSCHRLVPQEPHLGLFYLVEFTVFTSMRLLSRAPGVGEGKLHPVASGKRASILMAEFLTCVPFIKDERIAPKV